MNRQELSRRMGFLEKSEWFVKRHAVFRKGLKVRCDWRMAWPIREGEGEGIEDGRTGARVGSGRCRVLDLGITDTHKTGN